MNASQQQSAVKEMARVICEYALPVGEESEGGVRAREGLVTALVETASHVVGPRPESNWARASPGHLASAMANIPKGRSGHALAEPAELVRQVAARLGKVLDYSNVAWRAKAPLLGWWTRIVEHDTFGEASQDRAGRLAPSNPATSDWIMLDPARRLVSDFWLGDAYPSGAGLPFLALTGKRNSDLWIHDRDIFSQQLLARVDGAGAAFLVPCREDLPYSTVRGPIAIEASSDLQVIEQSIRLEGSASNTALRHLRIRSTNSRAEINSTICLLTSLPESIGGATIAELYCGRWSTEPDFRAFATATANECRGVECTEPALCRCVALVAYNIVNSLLESFGDEQADEDLPTALGLKQKTKATAKAFRPAPDWGKWRRSTAEAVARELVTRAAEIKASTAQLPMFPKAPSGGRELKIKPNSLPARKWSAGLGAGRASLRKMAKSAKSFVLMTLRARTPQWLMDPWLCGCLGTLVVVNATLFLLLPASTLEDQRRYVEVAGMLAQVREMRAKKVSDSEWQERADQLSQRAESLLAELNDEKEAPARQCLQWALQYRLPRVLKYGRYKHSNQEVAFEQLLQEARRHLKN